MTLTSLNSATLLVTMFMTVIFMRIVGRSFELRTAKGTTETLKMRVTLKIGTLITGTVITVMRVFLSL